MTTKKTDNDKAHDLLWLAKEAAKKDFALIRKTAKPAPQKTVLTGFRRSG